MPASSSSPTSGDDDVGGADPGLATQLGLFVGGLVVLATGILLLRGTGPEPTNS